MLQVGGMGWVQYVLRYLLWVSKFSAPQYIQQQSLQAYRGSASTMYTTASWFYYGSFELEEVLASMSLASTAKCTIS